MTKQEASYIAGFLDGDGCIMLQLVYRHDYVLGYQIRASIVFYQKQQHFHFMDWLKEKFTAGKDYFVCVEENAREWKKDATRTFIKTGKRSG